MQAIAERGHIGKPGFTQPQGLQISEVVSFGTDEQVVFQVGVHIARGLGWAFPCDADGKAAGVAGKSRSRWVSAEGGLKVRTKKASS